MFYSKSFLVKLGISFSALSLGMLAYNSRTSTLPDNFFESSVFAQESTEEAKKTPEGRFEICGEAANAYTHGALKFFNGQLCLFNVMFPRIAEDFMEKLTEKMGLNPDLGLLADDGTATALEEKVFLTKTITGTIQKVVSPDTFAGTYDYLVVVKVDGEDHMKMYFSGSGDASKGFLMRGGKGFRSDTELMYISWDRTTDDQTIHVLATKIGENTYLNNPQEGDRAMFGRATYNVTSKATAVQMTEIGPRRAAQSTSTTPACWYMYGEGVKGSDIVMSKTHDSCGQTGHDVTTTTKNGNVGGASGSCATNGKMDSASIVDDPATANGTGNSSNVVGTVSLYYSCADLDGADGAGKPFENNTVNFSMTKTQADAMFAAQ